MCFIYIYQCEEFFENLYLSNEHFINLNKKLLSKTDSQHEQRSLNISDDEITLDSLQLLRFSNLKIKYFSSLTIVIPRFLMDLNQQSGCRSV